MRALPLALLFLPCLAFSQHVEIQKKDSSKLDITVKRYTSRLIEPTGGDPILIQDISKVLLLDYDHARDRNLVRSLQSAGVMVAMGSSKERPRNEVNKMEAKPDSIRIAILETRVETMQYNMGRFHQQHQSGLLISLVGAVIATAAITIPEEPSNVVAYAGVGISVGGLIVTIDSYKWLKRATKRG